MYNRWQIHIDACVLIGQRSRMDFDSEEAKLLKTVS